MSQPFDGTAKPNYQLWRWCAWAGPLYCVTIIIAWAGIAGFLPPPSEYWSADEVYKYYSDNSLSIRIGMMLTLIVTPLYYVWGAAVSRVIARVEGRESVMSMIQLAGAFGTVVVTWGACVAWLAAAFQVDTKTAQDIKSMSDLAWMWFNPTVMVSITQFTAFGVAMLFDKGPNRLMPSWMPWFTFAMDATLFLAMLTPLFDHGMFSWHGLGAYYIGLGGFFIWILVASYYVLKAVDRLEREDRS